MLPSASTRPSCSTAKRDAYDISVITDDIYTREDQQILTRAGANPPSAAWASRPAATTWRRGSVQISA